MIGSPGGTLNKATGKVFKGKCQKTNSKRAFKNLIIASFGYCFVFTGFWGLANLQSTMNASDDLGVKSQAIIYVMSMFSALMFPDVLISKIGCKSVVVLGTLSLTLYITSNIYLWNVTIIFASVLFGLANGVHNTSLAFYINEMAIRYQANRSNEDLKVVMARFFGTFSIFIGLSNLSGNLISYLVLRPGSEDKSNQVNGNQTCGIMFNPKSNTINHNLDPPTDIERYTLVGVYVLLGVSAVIVLVCFLDTLKNDLKKNVNFLSMMSRGASGLKNMKNPQQLLLLPLTIFCGMEVPFLANEFTQAFIACSWGVYHIGFVNICFSVCSALTAFLVGPFVKRTSQLAAFTVAAIANLGICGVMFLWQPSTQTTFVFFVAAGVWGIADGIWWSQLPAYYGLLFPKDREAAYANFFFWGYVGSFLSYVYAEYLSIVVKLYLVVGFLSVGAVCFLVGHLRLNQFIKREGEDIEQNEQTKI